MTRQGRRFTAPAHASIPRVSNNPPLCLVKRSCHGRSPVNPDGRPVELVRADNSIYGHSPQRTFLGCYADVSALAPDVEHRVELCDAQGRTADAAVATAAADVLAGDHAAAVRTLSRLLAEASPGFPGWTIPVEPLLAPLRTDPGFRGGTRQARRSRKIARHPFLSVSSRLAVPL